MPSEARSGAEPFAFGAVFVGADHTAGVWDAVFVLETFMMSSLCSGAPAAGCAADALRPALGSVALLSFPVLRNRSPSDGLMRKETFGFTEMSQAVSLAG